MLLKPIPIPFLRFSHSPQYNVLWKTPFHFFAQYLVLFADKLLDLYCLQIYISIENGKEIVNHLFKIIVFNANDQRIR